MQKLLKEELKQIYGANAQFRDGQEEAILSVLNGQRTLVVEKTGWGKSLVYFLATKILRKQGKGITIIISPLIALMSNQIEQARKAGLQACTMNNINIDEWDIIKEDILQNVMDILIISPEHLNNDDFRDSFLVQIAKSIGMFVIDEAHCISDWGHDFRPDYRRIVKVLEYLPKNIPVLATTATANNRVIQDITEQLGNNLHVIRGSLTRESLAIEIIKLSSREERMAWIMENIEKLEGTGIIYCLTKIDCKLIHRWLTEVGVSSEIYDGDLSAEERMKVADAFMKNQIKVLVATIAFGMGVDKEDISFVIHFQKPANIVSYYQQIGRAGRGIPFAYAILLAGYEDDQINSYFIDSAFPTENEMVTIVDYCSNNNGLKTYQLEKLTGMRRGRIDKCTKYLCVEGILYKENAAYYKSPIEWKPDLERAKAVTRQREQELERMNEYVNSQQCYMQFIANELNDTTAQPCGKCANCNHKQIFGDTLKKTSISKAEYFLEHEYYTIEPRSKWPDGERIDNANRIKMELRMKQGLVLSNYSDCVYGKMVRDCKYNLGYFTDELIRASCERLENFISEHNITWITYIPSLRHPTLVKEFANKIAAHFSMPVLDAIIKTNQAEEQKKLTNNIQQFENAYNSFECTNSILEENVLLIDDMVDSRWTLTVCSYKLIKKGVNEVYPFALSNTAGASGGA